MASVKQAIGHLPRLPGVWWGMAGLALLLTGLAAALLVHLRADAVESQARDLRLLSTALADEIDRGLQGTEAGFLALRAELLDGRLDPADEAAAHALGTRADLMPLVRNLWLVDSHWKLLVASDDTPLPEAIVFPTPLARWDRQAATAVAISRPVPDAREADGIVVLALPFVVSGRAASGWILGAIPADALMGAFQVASPAADARIAVVLGGGVRLVGKAATPLPDTNTHATTTPSHARRIQTLANGTEQIVDSHVLPHHDLTLVLTRDLDAVLTPWRETAQFTAIGVALLLLTMGTAVGLVGRANRRRAEAQGALDAQLARASKLESLGTLAGGVAHDFNNILAAILGFGEMAQDAAATGSAQERQLGRVMQAALRGKALAERILAFSRGGAHASVVFELAPVVDEVLGMLAGSLRSGIVLERALDAAGARVRGDPTQAFEAVMNLCTNAMQATPGQGTVSVRLVRDRVAAPRVLSHSQLAPGRYLALSVSDQGIGITPQVMERLFEPFFTTRSAESGTGLGLAVVHGVVTESGGAIDVASTPGEGTRFTLYLPECMEPLSVNGAPAIALPGGTGQALLVVDDQPALTALAQEMLTALGYAPVCFNDPLSALEAFRAEPRRFAAVITDEVMPNLSGTALTQELRKLAAEVPVLLVSGYGGALLAARATEAGVSCVLSKPLQRAELARALAEALAR